jgi:hypothetical protein
MLSLKPRNLAIPHLSADFCSLFRADVVLGLIDDPAMIYNLHRDLLGQRCPYFKGCFDGLFKETEDKKTPRKEESSDVFDGCIAAQCLAPITEKYTKYPWVNTYTLADSDAWS